MHTIWNKYKAIEIHQTKIFMKKPKIAAFTPRNPSEAETDTPGYPAYPSSEDIFIRDKEESDLNPADISRKKALNEDPSEGKNNEKDRHDDPMGGDLDVPGSDLDDDMENIGSEDEENNYYSLGGDNHNDLDEDKTE
jgi:hypothetical protein